MIRIQPQSGLGDLIYSLPLIYALSQESELEIATNHDYAILRELNISKISLVDFGASGISIKKEGFIHLKYNRYGPHFFDQYYHPYTDLPLSESIEVIREIYRRGIGTNILEKYLVYAPPRAACRHKTKQESIRFADAPDISESERIVNSYNLPVVVVGKDDIYTGNICKINKIIDFRNILDFCGLRYIIANASCVISQASAITALAGLYEIPTHFLRAAAETNNQHEKHIKGIVWPGQEILT